MGLRKNDVSKGIAAAAIVALVLGAAAVGVAAQQAPRRGAGSGGFGAGAGAAGLRLHAAMRGMFLRGVKALDLTSDQKGQIKAAMQGHRDEFKAIARDMVEARSVLNDVVTADTVDDAAIKAASAKVAEVEARAALVRATVHREIFGLLTPDQQQKAKSMRDAAKTRIRTAMDRVLEP